MQYQYFWSKSFIGVSDETTARVVIDRAPSPVWNACNDTVDERTHKIQYVCCCSPYISCCQMAHYNDDWRDSFEEQSLFGCLFGSEEHEGAEILSEADRTSYDTMISHDQAILALQLQIVYKSVRMLVMRALFQQGEQLMRILFTILVRLTYPVIVYFQTTTPQEFFKLVLVVVTGTIAASVKESNRMYGTVSGLSKY